MWNGDGTNSPTDPGFADAWITGVEAYHDFGRSQQGWGTGDRSESNDSPRVVADIDGDGDHEIVFAGDYEHSAYCPETRRDSSRGFPMVEVEQPPKAQPTVDAAGSPVVVARQHPRLDELAGEPLVKALSMTVRAELAKQGSRVRLAEDHERVEALGAYRLQLDPAYILRMTTSLKQP